MSQNNLLYTHTHTVFLHKDGHVAPPAGKINKQNEYKMQTVLFYSIVFEFILINILGMERKMHSVQLIFFKGDKKDKEKPGQCYNGKKL